MKLKIKLDIKKKIIVYSSIFSLVAAGAIIFAILPWYSEISTKNTELYDQRVQLAIYQKQRLNLDETRQEYNDIKENIDDITSVLVKRDDILTFIDSLDDLASQNNIKQKIDLANLDESSQSTDLRMTINTTSSWDNIINYLNALENNKYYTIIDNPSLIKNDDGSIETQFILAIYLQ